MAGEQSPQGENWLSLNPAGMWIWEECCNQRALSPVFKPIMEPLPVGNQFVVISLCFGILTLCRESEERWEGGGFYRSALCSIMTAGAGISAVVHATHVSLTDKAEIWLLRGWMNIHNACL